MLGELGAPGAHEPENTQHLALVEGKVDAVGDAGLGQLANLERDLGPGLRRAVRVELRDVAPDHGRDHAVDGETRLGAVS